MPPANGEPELEVAVEPGEIQPDRAWVLRYLGYPEGARAAPRIEARLGAAIEDCRGRMRPRGTYAVYPVSARETDSITLGDRARFPGEIAGHLAGAQSAAVFVATAGPEIVEMAETATRRRDTLSGLVYNAIGSHVADAMTGRILQDLRGRIPAGQALTLPYSPGYCGISLAQQRTVFRLVDASRAGVELLPALIMKPVKSVSGLIGIGPRGEVEAVGNPCDRCPMTTCLMRRESR